MVGHAATALYVDTVELVPPVGPDLLAEAGFSVRRAVAATAAEVVAAAAGVDAILVGDSPIDEAVFTSIPSLRIVATVTVGVDHVDLDAARRAGVWVANVPDATTEEVAVSALAMALGLVRHLPFLDRHVRAGGWDAFATGPRRRPSTLTLGIVGLGRIGRRLAEIASPVFGAVVAHDPAPAAPWPAAVGRVALDDLLARSDVVSLHLPATPGTRPLLDAHAIASMRPGAYLVNVARGALVDTAAVVAALDDGRLAGAALDVLEVEPPAPEAAVRHHPRALVTPHAAFWSEEGETEAYARQAANVVAWRRTGRPATPVVEGRTPEPAR